MSAAKAKAQAKDTAKSERALEYLADARFHQHFVLPASTVTTRTAPTRVTYCDAGYRDSDHKAVILLCGGMFAGRWMGVLWDKFARKRKVRIIGVDRPGVGGTPSVLLEERVQTWLEIVPALLDHLHIEHVALVSHSAGTIYLMNSLLHHRRFLHPRNPYVALLAPWVHPSHSSSSLMYLANMVPSSLVSRWHHLVKFSLGAVNATPAPLLAISSGISFQSLSTSSLFASSATDSNSAPEPPPTATSKTTHNLTSSLTMKYIFAEDTSGASQDALLCLQKPANHWGSWHDTDTFVPLLAAAEQAHGASPPPHDGTPADPPAKLRIHAYHAEKDALIGKAGSAWWDRCWRDEAMASVIEYESVTVAGTDHDSICEAGWGTAPVDEVLGEVVGRFG